MSPVGVRRLPVAVAPFPAETLASYIARLAAADHLRHDTLADHLHEPATPGARPAPDRLAAASGWPVLTLGRALPDLVSGHQDLWWQHRRLACRSCAAARGIHAPVTRWVPTHLEVCVAHRRWIGSTVTSLADQHDLAGVPDVVVAARRHHRLVRRHGQHNMNGAYHDARSVSIRWAEHGSFGRHRDRRLQLLALGRRLAFDDPALQASIHPEVVGLTSLMASPYWVSAAASPNTAVRDRFYHEAARRLDMPEYHPHSPHDPLAKWVTVESRSMLIWLRQGPSTRNLSLPLSETDRCHAQRN